jgi:acyl-CoA thioester hydrolase
MAETKPKPKPTADRKGGSQDPQGPAAKPLPAPGPASSDAPAGAAARNQGEGLAPGADDRLRLDMLFRFGLTHRIRYDEVSAQGFVSSGAWLDLLHWARGEYLRGLGVFIEGGSAPVQMVVRRAAVEFLAPARFDDAILIRLRCTELGHTHARFEAIADSADGLRLLVAELVVVCVDVASSKSIAWPVVFRERVRAYEGPSLQIGQLMR